MTPERQSQILEMLLQVSKQAGKQPDPVIFELLTGMDVLRDSLRTAEQKRDEAKNKWADLRVDYIEVEKEVAALNSQLAALREATKDFIAEFNDGGVYGVCDDAVRRAEAALANIPAAATEHDARIRAEERALCVTHAMEAFDRTFLLYPTDADARARFNAKMRGVGVVPDPRDIEHHIAEEREEIEKARAEERARCVAEVRRLADSCAREPGEASLLRWAADAIERGDSNAIEHNVPFYEQMLAVAYEAYDAGVLGGPTGRDEAVLDGCIRSALGMKHD